MSTAVIHTRYTPGAALVAVVIGTCADVEVRVFASPAESAADARTLTLDGFEYLLGRTGIGAGRVVTYLSDAEVLRELRAVAGVFPSVEFVSTVRGRGLELMRRAVEAMAEHERREDEQRRAEAEEARVKASVKPLVVATDASKGRGPLAGIACLAADGRHRSGVVERVDSVAHAELCAIALALKTFARPRLRVLTDSQVAIAYLESRMAPSGRISITLDEIRWLSRGRDIRYSWVRGHAGHALNETADRLAVYARRTHQAQVAPEVRVAVAREIVAPLLVAA